MRRRRTTVMPAFGLRTTGKLITGAALIMVVVFSGFASAELVEFQQMGFELAIAVLLDATLVRSVLVPATMIVLGRLNWYLPASLRWLPVCTDPLYRSGARRRRLRILSQIGIFEAKSQNRVSENQ